MKFKTASSALALAAACFASGAMATPAMGPYVGLSLGHSHLSVDATPGVNVEKSGTSYALTGGVRLNPTFAVEAEYARLADVTASAGGQSATVRANSVSVSGLGIVSVTNKAEAFVRAGLAYTYVDGAGQSRNAVKPILGLGADYMLSSRTSLRGEVQYTPDFAGSSANQLNTKVSVNYRF